MCEESTAAGLKSQQLPERKIHNCRIALTRLANRIDVVKMKNPSFLMVLTATGDVAYRRPEDGVFVCPLSSLRP